jgi:hypothetical protein
VPAKNCSGSQLAAAHCPPTDRDAVRQDREEGWKAVGCRWLSQPVPYPFDSDRGRNEENFIPRDIAGLDPAQNLSDKVACGSRAHRLESD